MTPRDRAQAWVDRHLPTNTATTKAKAYDAYLAGWIAGRVDLSTEEHADTAAQKPRPTEYACRYCGVGKVTHENRRCIHCSPCSG